MKLFILLCLSGLALANSQCGLRLPNKFNSASTRYERSGDSGGPLMMEASDGRWFQIGITTFGIPTDIFTDIRKYCDWIKETTEGEASCQDEEVTLEDVETQA